MNVTFISKPVEAAEGRTAHNNVWNGVNGMAYNNTIGIKHRETTRWIPFQQCHSSHYQEPVPQLRCHQPPVT